MKFISSTLLVFLLGLVIFTSSCSTPKDLEFREFNNLNVEKIGFTGAWLNVDLVYYNPNNFGMELNHTDLDIYLDSVFLGHSSQDVQVAIRKRELFTLPLKVELDMKNLLKNGLITLIRKQVTVRAVGQVRVGKAGVFKVFKVDYSTVQDITLF